MAYFVSYKLSIPSHSDHESNVILRHTHPILWAANPPDAAKDSNIHTTLMWWIEIDDNLCENPAVKKWVNIEE